MENQITKEDHSKIEELSIIFDVQDIQIHSLCKYTNLKRLSIVKQRLSSIEGVELLVSLEKLWLNENAIIHLKGIEKCTRLTLLNVSDNQITNLGNDLADLVNLDELWIKGNNLQSLDGIQHCKNLRAVYAADNRIQCFSNNFHNLKKLEILDVSGNYIFSAKSISSLISIPNLIHILFTSKYSSPNPIALTSNYIHTILQLFPNLKSLDGDSITMELRESLLQSHEAKLSYYRNLVFLFGQASKNCERIVEEFVHSIVEELNYKITAYDYILCSLREAKMQSLDAYAECLASLLPIVNHHLHLHQYDEPIVASETVEEELLKMEKEIEWRLLQARKSLCAVLYLKRFILDQHRKQLAFYLENESRQFNSCGNQVVKSIKDTPLCASIHRLITSRLSFDQKSNFHLIDIYQYSDMEQALVFKQTLVDTLNYFIQSGALDETTFQCVTLDNVNSVLKEFDTKKQASIETLFGIDSLKLNYLFTLQGNAAVKTEDINMGFKFTLDEIEHVRTQLLDAMDACAIQRTNIYTANIACRSPKSCSSKENITEMGCGEARSSDKIETRTCYWENKSKENEGKKWEYLKNQPQRMRVSMLDEPLKCFWNLESNSHNVNWEFESNSQVNKEFIVEYYIASLDNQPIDSELHCFPVAFLPTYSGEMATEALHPAVERLQNCVKAALTMNHLQGEFLSMYHWLERCIFQLASLRDITPLQWLSLVNHSDTKEAMRRMFGDENKEDLHTTATTDIFLSSCLDAIKVLKENSLPILKETMETEDVHFILSLYVLQCFLGKRTKSHSSGVTTAVNFSLFQVESVKESDKDSLRPHEAKLLNLKHNSFSSLPSIMASFPANLYHSLEEIDLSFNSIEYFGNPLPTENQYTSVTTLDLSYNKLSSIKQLLELSQFFPNILHLKVEGLGFLDRELLLHSLKSVFPNIQSINGYGLLHSVKTYVAPKGASMVSYKSKRLVDEVRKKGDIECAELCEEVNEVLSVMQEDIMTYRRFQLNSEKHGVDEGDWFLNQAQMEFDMKLANPPSAFCKIRDLSQITTLDLRNCYLRNPSAHAFSPMVQLLYLNLSNNLLENSEYLLPLKNTLQTLVLDNNQISDMSVLSSLLQLHSISIRNNHISDVHFSLAHHRNLKHFIGDGNPLDSLDFLLNNKSLIMLSMQNTCLEDLRCLTALKRESEGINEEGSDTGKRNSLIYVWFTDSPICEQPNYRANVLCNVRSISFLDGEKISNDDINTAISTEKQKLTIEKLEALSHSEAISLHYMKNINLSNMSLSEIQDVLYQDLIPSCTSLNLSSNLLRTVNTIGPLSKLQTLDLSANFLSSMNSLQVAMGDENYYDDTGLNSLVNLKTLILDNNQITNLQILSSCCLNQLTTLSLVNNKIESLCALNRLFPSLKELRLGNNKLKSINFFETFEIMPSLKVLDLKNNALKGCMGIEEALPQLEELNLSNNRVINICTLDTLPLQNLANLRHLVLLNNPVSRRTSYRNTLIRLYPTVKEFDYVIVTDEERMKYQIYQQDTHAQSLPLSATIGGFVNTSNPPTLLASNLYTVPMMSISNISKAPVAPSIQSRVVSKLPTNLSVSSERKKVNASVLPIKKGIQAKKINNCDFQNVLQPSSLLTSTKLMISSSNNVNMTQSNLDASSSLSQSSISKANAWKAKRMSFINIGKIATNISDSSSLPNLKNISELLGTRK